MYINFTLEEKDYLNYQLFTASKSELIKKKKVNSWLILTIGSFVLGLYFFLINYFPLSIYCGVLTFVFGIFYPKYFIWRYKKHYKSYIKEHYSNRFGQTIEMKFDIDEISSKDKTGSGIIKLTEIKDVSETLDYFYVHISTGVSIIIPKKQLESSDNLKNHFLSLGLDINNELDWKWT
jgi:hypothetical protein